MCIKGIRVRYVEFIISCSILQGGVEIGCGLKLVKKAKFKSCS